MNALIYINIYKFGNNFVIHGRPPNYVEVHVDPTEVSMTIETKKSKFTIPIQKLRKLISKFPKIFS